MSGHVAVLEEATIKQQCKVLTCPRWRRNALSWPPKRCATAVPI